MQMRTGDSNNAGSFSSDYVVGNGRDRRSRCLPACKFRSRQSLTRQPGKEVTLPVLDILRACRNASCDASCDGAVA